MMKSGAGQWLIAAGMALLVLGGYLTWRSLPAGPLPAGEMPATVIRDDQPLPVFALTGLRGKFGNADLAGRWSFMFFGYTQCPDVCPTALALMKELRAELGAVSSAPTFQVVFVSVDPRRDTPELLSGYMAAFDPAFIGVSGDDAALAPLAKALGVFYQRNDASDVRRYTVDHSTAIYLIDPQGHRAAVFSPPQTASRLADDYRRIARQ